MELRDYQKKAIEEIEEILKLGNDAVLASSPSSGKTIMAIEFIKRNKGSFLILTHGQVILKEMWEKELKKHLSPNDFLRVTYGLPQGLQNREISKVDFVIIDEAHEFTFADMVSRILEVNKESKKIYLTGTPSKFIEKQYPVVVIPAIELIEKGYVSDLYVGLFSTTANIRQSDRNESEDLKKDSCDKLEKSVKSDLDSLLDSMIARLASSGMTKDKPYLAKATSWVPILKEIDKTMIACASIKQAEEVAEYFVNKGIDAISSNSIDDPESLNIQRFMTESSIQVLVVVDRAVLGFNMENLVNVVDMTCSHNINRIYQLYARVMRKNDQNKKKYFFKLTVENEMQVSKFYMEAALCLMYGSFISRYNGKNLNLMQIPVIVKTKTPIVGTSVKNIKQRERKITVDDELFNTVTAAKLMADLYNKAGQEFNEYAMVTLGTINREALGKPVQIDWTSTKTIWEGLISNGYATEELNICEYENKIIRWLTENFKDRSELISKQRRIYDGLIKQHEQILNRAFKVEKTHKTKEKLPIKVWTIEEVKKEALKYKTKTEFSKKSPGAYQKALRMKNIDTICSHMPKDYNTPWTIERLKEEAKKYKSGGEFKRKNPGAYNKAAIRGVLYTVCQHMKLRKKWTEEDVALEALKYKTKTEFIKLNNDAYQAAQRKKIVDKVCRHMKKEFK